MMGIKGDGGWILIAKRVSVVAGMLVFLSLLTNVIMPMKSFGALK